MRCLTRRSEHGVTDDPFRVLGLPPRADLTDDDVRAGWRRIAAATHPDRDDGGDPVSFGAATAAYALLRTAYGRGEALADLESHARRTRHGWRGQRGQRGRRGSQASRGSRRGRPGLLALRVLGTAGAGALTVAVAGWTPATVGVLAGALTWLVATARHDLPRRRGRAGAVRGWP
jgi:curved DNA-binding protein CbpA